MLVWGPVCPFVRQARISKTRPKKAKNGHIDEKGPRTPRIAFRRFRDIFVEKIICGPYRGSERFAPIKIDKNNTFFGLQRGFVFSFCTRNYNNNTKPRQKARRTTSVRELKKKNSKIIKIVVMCAQPGAVDSSLRQLLLFRDSELWARVDRSRGPKPSLFLIIIRSIDPRPCDAYDASRLPCS